MSGHDCKHEVEIATIKIHVERMAVDVADIKKCLITGNGVAPMTVRVAKVEQTIGAGVWLAGVIVVAMIGLLFDLARRMI